MVHWGCALQLPLPHRPTSAADQGSNEQRKQANHCDVQVCVIHHKVETITLNNHLITCLLPSPHHSTLTSPNLYPHLISALPYTFSDGMSRTGAFICMHHELERVKVEGVVDIFHCIKASRISRPCLVQNVVCPTFYIIIHLHILITPFNAHLHFTGAVHLLS